MAVKTERPMHVETYIDEALARFAPDERARHLKTLALMFAVRTLYTDQVLRSWRLKFDPQPDRKQFHEQLDAILDNKQGLTSDQVLDEATKLLRARLD